MYVCAGVCVCLCVYTLAAALFINTGIVLFWRVTCYVLIAKDEKDL